MNKVLTNLTKCAAYYQFFIDNRPIVYRYVGGITYEQFQAFKKCIKLSHQFNE